MGYAVPNARLRSLYVVPSPISAQHKMKPDIQISPFTIRDSESWPSSGDDNLESHHRRVRTKAQVRADLSSIPSFGHRQSYSVSVSRESMVYIGVHD